MKIGRILGTGLAFGYPLVVWYALDRGASELLALAAVGALLATLLRVGPSGVRTFVRQFWTLALPVMLAVVTGLTGREEPVLLTPVVVNLGLLFAFATSLRSGRQPLVERFARLREPELEAEQIRYCRRVTAVWIGFFAGNATVAAVLAFTAPLGWWAAYVGGIAYVLIGLLFTSEWVVRKIKFRRYADAPLDRLLAHLFPPRRP